MTNERPRRARRYAPPETQDQHEEPVKTVHTVEPELLATNNTVKLTCTLAAMMSLFALFLCFAEKQSRAIRTYAVQSVALTALHLASGAVLLAIGGLLGGIPLLGFLIVLVCWIVYIAVLVASCVIRVRMMFAAWNGYRFDLPVIGKLVESFI